MKRAEFSILLPWRTAGRGDLFGENPDTCRLKLWFAGGKPTANHGKSSLILVFQRPRPLSPRRSVRG